MAELIYPELSYKIVGILFQADNQIGYGHRESYYLDFLVENKIVLEIKSGDRFNRENVSQVYDYLKANHLDLGILANFTRQGVKFKRIIYKY